MEGECRYSLLLPGEIVATWPAWVAGTLFHLGFYPGLLLSQTGGNGKVQGELIKFNQLDRILVRLDEEEGPEYRRQLLAITREDGTIEQAWCYVLASHPGPSSPIIESGTWRSC